MLTAALSPHRAARSRTRWVAPAAPAHRGSLSPRRVRRTAGDRTSPPLCLTPGAGRSPRHASRPGSLASHRTPPVALRVTRPQWPSSACVELGRSTSIAFQASARIPAIPAERVRDHRDPSATIRSSSGCRASSRRDAVRRPRTDRTHPSPSGMSSALSTAAGRCRQLVTDPEDPSSPVSRAVHRVAHCGAIFCGYRLQATTRLPSHGRERHSYTACGWSCPQSSTGLLWVFTSAECGRRR